MDMTERQMTSSFGHSTIAELTASLHKEDASPVCLDGAGLSQKLGDDAEMNSISIKKELIDDAAKNGISHCLSSDNFKGSKQYVLSQAVKLNHRTLGFRNSVSQSQPNSPIICGPLILQSKDCNAGRELSHVSGVQVVPVSASRVGEDLKLNCTGIIPNHTNSLSSSIVSSEILGGCSSVAVTLPSVMEPMLNYTDNLFDASIISPISPLGSGISVPGSSSTILSTSFQPLTLENHDVCQSVMMTEVLKMEKNTDSFTSLHSIALSPSNGLVNSSSLNMIEQCRSGMDNIVKSERQSKSQGLTDSHEMCTHMRIPNGLSCIYSTKPNISQSSLCANVGMTCASDNLLAKNQSCASFCDSTIQGVFESNTVGVNILAKNTFPTCTVPTSSLATDDGAPLITDFADSRDVILKDLFQCSSYKETALNLTSNENLPSEMMAQHEKDESSSDRLLASKLKTPRAKKSCGPRPKQLQQPLDRNHTSANVSEAMDAHAVESETVTTDSVPARTTLSSMTIKLPELENVLGIGYKSLDKMDAKTLDRIVLAKAQKNARLEAELERSKVPINLEGSGRRFLSNSISEKTVQDILSDKAEKEKEILKVTSKRTVNLTEETLGKHTPSIAVGHCDGDERPTGSGPHCVLDASKENKFISTKTEKICSRDCNECIANSDRGCNEGLSEKRDDSLKRMKAMHENKQASTSGHTTAVLPSVTVANGMIFKARKSQGYAFGRVKHVRDVLNSPELHHSPSLTKPTEVSPAKSSHASRFTVQAKARKQAVSPHLSVKPKTANSQPSADKSGNLSESERRLSQDEINSLKRRPNGHFCSTFSPDGLPSKSKRQKLMSHPEQSFLNSRGKSKSNQKFAHGFEKHDTLERASVSSSSSADNFTFKLPHKMADKISYPVTPPRSPEGCAVQSSDELSSQMNSDASGYLKPHCCCQQSVTLNLENLATCQALESVDGKRMNSTEALPTRTRKATDKRGSFQAPAKPGGRKREKLKPQLSREVIPICHVKPGNKIIGCTRKWTNKKIVRPSTRIPFMAMCDKHLQLLSDHQCCPGCGQFCVQGEFYQCKQSSTGEVHSFHRHCQVFHGTSYLCPHCGAESIQESVVLQAMERFSSSQNVSTHFRHSRNARLSGLSTRRRSQKRDGSVCSTSNSISSSVTSRNSQPDDLLGINQKELQASIAAIMALGKEKQKKVRPCAKSFYAACKNGELDRVIYMIDEGIDPNLRPDDYSESCLHIAVRHGQKEVVKLLLQAGALPNSLDLNLYTPIMVAAVGGRLALLEILVKAGGSLHYRAVDGMTVLHLAAKSGQLDVIHFLVENYRLDVNVKDDGGWTPLIWATEYKHSATVKYLLKMEANPNIQDRELNTGLHWAAYAGCTGIAEMFLNSGCDLECANEHGDRPLHIAARQDHYECVSFLLMRGADAGALNKANITPAECCPEKSTSTRTVLLLNQRIKRSTLAHPNKPERLVHNDVSLGRESNPITVVNAVDNFGVPDDFTYVADYVETNTININRVITSLRMCNCKDGDNGKEECATINCHCVRSSIKCWYDKEGHLTEEFNFHDPPLIYECNRACRCHANCQNRVIQLGITCRLQVFRTHHRGWGCRTLLSIPKGSFVCEYFGELISDAEADRRQDDSYLFDLDNQDTETFCVDAAKFGNVSRFINHLCEPNLTPVKVFVDHQDLRFPRMCFFANRDIKANEELGFDYGDKFWVIKYKDFTCDCGSPKCRYSVNTIGQTLEDFKRRQEEESVHAGRT